MAKAATKATDKRTKTGKKKLPKSFIIALICFIGLPIAGLETWYIVTATLEVSGSKLSASEMVKENISKARFAMRNKMAEQAKLEGFQIEDVDKCTEIEDQYMLPQGVVFTDLTKRQLVGLPPTATLKEVNARCIIFAKVVMRMEKLSHHDRHVFVCQGASFSNDESGRFTIIADPKGRGVIESFGGNKKLIKIPRGSHALVREWQIFNLGDGCVIIGLSKNGAFSMSGSVNVQ